MKQINLRAGLKRRAHKGVKREMTRDVQKELNVKEVNKSDSGKTLTKTY